MERQQQTMNGFWQEAEAAARAAAILHAEHRMEMLNTLRAAAHTLGYAGPIRDSLFAFLNQVFERTNDGHGPAWWPEKAEKSILGWPGGPSCRRSKLYEIIADLRDAGILAVVPYQGDSRRCAYAVAWDVVFDICGKPLPRHLVGAAVAHQCVPAAVEPPGGDCHEGVQSADSVHGVDSPVHAVDKSVHAVDTSVHAVDWKIASGAKSAPLNALPSRAETAPSRARAHVDLILDDFDEDENKNIFFIKIKSSDPAWARLKDGADRLAVGLYRHLPGCPSISRRGRVFLASVALLSDVLCADWVADAVDGVREFKAKNPPAYLHACLRRNMAGYLKGGSPEECERLLGIVRPAVSRWVMAHDWRPDAAVARHRAETGKTKAKDRSEKAWSELTAAEREEIQREDAAFIAAGGMKGLLRASQQLGAAR